jgi:hypothetical protein
MRKVTVFFMILAVAVACGSSVNAALVFNADFAQDGTYDASWPMKAGDVVSVDIYVSDVPEPGLISMGFKLTYDSSKLEVMEAGTAVDTGNWPAPYLKTDILGEIEMAGVRLGEGLTGLAGNNIRLGTVTFRCISEGTSAFMLLDREGDWFVLDSEEEIVVDGDIGAGVLLTTIRPPILGDVNGDGLVNLADAIVVLKVMAKMEQGEVVPTTGDVNGDGKIGLAEASYVFQKAAGLR